MFYRVKKKKVGIKDETQGREREKKKSENMRKML